MLKATIFGKFSLSDGKTVLREEDIRADKLVQLLVYIISRRDNVVTGKKLGELLWLGGSKNPENALKNLIYRLRSVLKALGPEEYICTRPGGYRWNPDIPIVTDYEEFEKLGSEIEKQTDKQATKEICRQVIDCYRGEVSVRLTYETWLQPQIINYQATYLKAVKILCDIYEQESEWAELERLCQKVVEYEPLDEDIQSWLVRSLQKQQKYD